ncbi:MAG: hypothetical protein FJ276_33165 [Planctomycetes bacterium]|nr:hypothetical protein [Planctomycetota bacterium]
MKWLKCLVAVLSLTCLVAVPCGCGSGQTTEIKVKDEPTGPAGHEEAFNTGMEGQATQGEGAAEEGTVE